MENKSHIWALLNNNSNDEEKIVVKIGDIRQLVSDVENGNGNLISVREASGLLGVTTVTVYNRIAKGKYPDIKKVNERWHITRESIGL